MRQRAEVISKGANMTGTNGGKAANTILLTANTDGPMITANALAEFIHGAQSTLDICIFDFRLTNQPAAVITQALKSACDRRVTVRIAFNKDKPKGGKAKAEPAAVTLFRTGGHPATPGTAAFIATLDRRIKSKAIDPGSHLMHDKYIIRDKTAIWTGSTNFTNDAWSRQENNILQLESRDLCTYYQTDFDELWRKAAIWSSGKNDTGTVEVNGHSVTVAFSPGDGKQIDDRVASRITGAQTRVVIASMVISSENVLTALTGKIEAGVSVSGIYDATQMGQVAKQWGKGPAGSGKAAMFEELSAHLVGKHSTPYRPTGPHDFMHDKVVVVDDTVITGSFNFSANATKNAENILFIDDAGIAEDYVSYIDNLVALYKSTGGSAPAQSGRGRSGRGVRRM